MKLLVRFLFLATLTTAAVVPAHAGTLSRAEAVAAALKSNPEVQKSVEERSRLEGMATEARADALPDITFSASALRYRDPSLLNASAFDSFPPELRDALKPTAANLFEGVASLRQTLFSFKLGKARRAARLGTALGKEGMRQAQQGVALLAVLAYNDYLLSLEQVRVAEESVRQKDLHLEMARNRRAAGVATDLDVLRSQVDLENTRAQLLRFRGLAGLSMSRLNAVMVRPIDDPIQPTDSLEYLPFELSLDEVIREAWANRPEAKAATLNEKIRYEYVGIVRADAQPSLELNAAWGYSVRQPENFFNQDYSRWSAMVSLKVPLFDGLRTPGRVTQARAELGKAVQDKVALENQVRMEAKQAVDVLAVAGSILQVAELTVAQAQKALDMTQANYNHGAATTLDVMDAQAALTQAEITRVQALHQHANARASLRFVMARNPLEQPKGAQE
jgi:HAE1 family hydrophobic/amphiphilic exporter-1